MPMCLGSVLIPTPTAGTRGHPAVADRLVVVAGDIRAVSPTPPPTMQRALGTGGTACRRRPRWAAALLVATAAATATSVALWGATPAAATRRPLPTPPPAIPTRTVYLSADTHRFSATRNSTDVNQCSGAAYTDGEALFIRSAPGLVGDTYTKGLWTRHAAAGWASPVTPPPHMGAVGAALYVAAGERLAVVVRNTLPFAVSWEVGQLVPSAGNPASVAPGEEATWTFDVPAEAAPVAGHGTPLTDVVPSRVLVYRSGVDASHLDAGLYGPLVVTAAGVPLDADGVPADTDHIFTFLHVMNEAVSPFAAASKDAVVDEWARATAAGVPAVTDEDEIAEAALMHGINGFVYCAMPPPELDVASRRRVLWHAAAVGNEVDVHTLHLHGIVGVSGEGRGFVDMVRLLPMTGETMAMVVDKAGIWLGHCHINDHLMAGMTMLFAVKDSGSGAATPVPTPPRGRVRHYFVAAVEEEWDYAPAGANTCSAKTTPFTPDEAVFTAASTDAAAPRVGSMYTKSRYVEYTDATFTTVVERPPEWAHLGLVGPLLRAAVGDTLRVTFRNAASHPATMHPHGVRYSKSSEGAPYADGTSGADKADDGVPPGGTHVYIWEVPARAGPAAGEGGKVWMYHSHFNEIADTYGGLFGLLLIVGTERGAGYDPDTTLPSGGEREIVLFFGVMDENESVHGATNAARAVRASAGNETAEEVATAVEELLGDNDFRESNLMHGINGYVYCNAPLLTLTRGDPVKLYLFSLGTEVDLHTPLFASTALAIEQPAGSTTSAPRLLPGMFLAASATPRVAGRSLVQCGVADHIHAGMTAAVQVTPGGEACDDDDVDKDGDCGDDFGTGAAVVRIHLAAEVVEWDYVAAAGRPGSDTDRCSGAPFGAAEQVFTDATDLSPGGRYLKAVYREYTSRNLSTRVVHPLTPSAGLAGPTVHLQVGEMLVLTLTNRLPWAANWDAAALTPVSAVVTGAAAAAATDRTGTALGRGDSVFPGETVTYTWAVPPEAAPSPADLSTVGHAYVSSVDPIPHAAAGLYGIVAVGHRGALPPPSVKPGGNRVPVGTADAVALALNIQRENESPLVARNVAAYALNGSAAEAALAAGDLDDDEEWAERQTLHAIGGHLYCHGPPVVMTAGAAPTRVYVFGFGSEASMHTPVWAGRLTTSSGGRTSSQIFPYVVHAVDVYALGAGPGRLSCAVTDHLVGGMTARLLVREGNGGRAARGVDRRALVHLGRRRHNQRRRQRQA